MRMASLPSAAIIPALFITMIPLIVIFSLPVSALMAVKTTVGSLIARDELLFIYFSARAQVHLILACALFSLTVTCFFAPFVCIWAPQAYLKGKNLIIDFAKNQFHELAPGMLHTPLSGLAFSYNKKVFFEKQYAFNELFLAFDTKEREHCIFTAEYGLLRDDTLILHNGSMVITQPTDSYHALFKRCEIRIHDLIEGDHEQPQAMQVKFLTITQLWHRIASDSQALNEFLKRLSQLLWQFVFPLIALLWILIFPRVRGYLIRAFLLSGVLFLMMHVSFAVAYTLSNSLCLVLLILFGFPLSLLIGLFWRFIRIR